MPTEEPAPTPDEPAAPLAAETVVGRACEVCGTRNDDGLRFCSKCGVVLSPAGRG